MATVRERRRRSARHQRKTPAAAGVSVELAGLEPASSWVRSRPHEAFARRIAVAHCFSGPQGRSRRPPRHGHLPRHRRRGLDEAAARGRGGGLRRGTRRAPSAPARRVSPPRRSRVDTQGDAFVEHTLGAKDGLRDHIAARDLLLLIDNLEHVVEAAPNSRRSSKRVRTCACSRRVRGEREGDRHKRQRMGRASLALAFEFAPRPRPRLFSRASAATSPMSVAAGSRLSPPAPPRAARRVGFDSEVTRERCR